MIRVLYNSSLETYNYASRNFKFMVTELNFYYNLDE